jgi:tetratricopeptide (TPR) repeat protein
MGMGAFFNSIHIRTEDSDAVHTALEQLAKDMEYQFWVGPPTQAWICVCPNEIGSQPVSAKIAALVPYDVLHLMVHDDDVFYYYFYRDRKLIDQFNSCPGYFNDSAEDDPEPSQGHPELLQDLLPDKNSLDKLKKLLAADHFTFESERMAEFAKLFHLPNALTSYDHLDTGVDEEVEHLEKFIHIEFEPETAEDYNYRGEVKLAKEDADGALADFQKALELKPDLAAARDNLAHAGQVKGDRSKALARHYLTFGRQASANKNFEEALGHFNKAIELDPEFALAYSSRGMLKRSLGDLDGALADLNKALELKADLPETYIVRAATKNAKGDLDGALADYDRAIELKPDSAKAHNNRGELRRKKGDITGALADYDRAIELKPAMAVYYSNRSLVKLKKRDWDGALSDSDRAIELSPELATAYNNRGMAKQLKGDLDGALEDYHKAVALSPNLEAFRINRDKAMQIKESRS